MAGREHRYTCAVTWTGNTGSGTTTYTGYSRDHTINAAGKPVIPGSSDPAFRGDAARYNPEDLLVASPLLPEVHLREADAGDEDDGARDRELRRGRRRDLPYEGLEPAQAVAAREPGDPAGECAPLGGRKCEGHAWESPFLMRKRWWTTTA